MLRISIACSVRSECWSSKLTQKFGGSERMLNKDLDLRDRFSNLALPIVRLLVLLFDSINFQE